MANPTGPSPSDAAMTVLIYVNTNKQVGDPNHFKVFANADAAENLVHGKRSRFRKSRHRMNMDWN
jgi:hypothetical protein